MKSFLLVSTRTEVNGEIDNHPVYGKPEIELTGTMQVCPACNSIILGQNAPKCLCGQALVRSGSPAAEMSSIVNWKSGDAVPDVCRFYVGQKVIWNGQQGETEGVITSIGEPDPPENPSYVLWIGDFPINSADVRAAHVHPMTLRECMEAEEPTAWKERAEAAERTLLVRGQREESKRHEFQMKIDEMTKPLHIKIERLTAELAEGAAGEAAPQPTRNSEVLASFVRYCQENPEHRFWQALRNWSGYHFILAARHSINPLMNKSGMWCDEQDTFSWEGKRHDEPKS